MTLKDLNPQEKGVVGVPGIEPMSQLSQYSHIILAS